MSEHGWQWQTKVAVTFGTPVAVRLPDGRPLLEKLTVWASSGVRVLTDMTCQPRLNEKNFGSSTAFVGVAAADPIFDSNAVGRILPVNQGGAPPTATSVPVDPIVFDVLLTNAAAATTETVTLYFAAIGRDGGCRT